MTSSVLMGAYWFLPVIILTNDIWQSGGEISILGGGGGGNRERRKCAFSA